MSDQQHIKTVPLSRVVVAAAIDQYEDFGTVQHRFQHWAARGLKKFEGETLKKTRRSAIIRVSRNTRTAALPCGFDEILYVGVANNKGERVPLKMNSSLIDLSGLIDPEEEICSVCSQKKNICNELQVSETMSYVNIDGTSYEQKVIKRLYENGDYCLETHIPVPDEDGNVDYIIEKETIANIDKESCGCIKNTEANVAVLRHGCPEVYWKYFAPISTNCTNDYGTYRILEEQGLIQFSQGYKFDYAYIEFTDYIPKINGQYHIPEDAFEALVEWVKWKSIQNRKGVNRGDKIDQERYYKEARNNMEIRMNRVSLSHIINCIGLLPKFDLDFRYSTSECCNRINSYRPIVYADNTVVSSPSSQRGSLSRIVGVQSDAPDNESTSWQHDSLIGAEVDFIILNNVTLSRLSGAFNFLSDSGVIQLTNGEFANDDVIVVPYIKTK